MAMPASKIAQLANVDLESRDVIYVREICK
jgi:hypothetical protein